VVTCLLILSKAPLSTIGRVEATLGIDFQKREVGCDLGGEGSPVEAEVWRDATATMRDDQARRLSLGSGGECRLTDCPL